jgi:hypothetical protein
VTRSYSHPLDPARPGPEGMPKRRRRRFFTSLTATALAVATPALVAVAAPASADAAATSTSLVALAGAKAQVPSGAKAVSATSASKVISGAVALKVRDAAGLSALAADVSDPSSSLYKHYLSASAFDSRFSPAASTVTAVKSELKDAGLQVTSVATNGLLVDWKGTVSHAAAAFHTGFDNFRLSSGQTVYAQTATVRLPASIASSVQSVVGLNDIVTPEALGLPAAVRGSKTVTRAKALAPASSSDATAGGPAACADATATAAEYGGLTDTQIANAYGVNGLYSAGDTGAGETIAVYELEPYRLSDIKAFDTCYFGATKAATMVSNITNVAVDGGQQVGPGSGESELDIDDVSAIAPSAKIRVYLAPNSETGGLDEYNTIVSQDAAQEITSSWGECESEVQQFEPGVQSVENSIFEEAALQGETVLSAAGDDGVDTCAAHAATPVAPVFSLNDPASQPYVISVGGTTITDATDPPKETVWNDGNEWGAGGGGISSTWNAPAYQKDSDVPGLFNSNVLAKAKTVSADLDESFCSSDLADCRETPDVSAQADEFTGAITIYYDGAWLTIGGTSSATPLWAAMLADVNSTKACTTNGAVGFANPALYAVASIPSEYKTSFNDITVGNNDVFGATEGLFPATAGYDMASGLGSPRITDPSGAHGLAYYLCDTASSAKPTVTDVSPAATSATASNPITVTGTGFMSGSTDEVAGVTVGQVYIPGSDVTVSSATSLSFSSPLGTAETANGAGGDGTGQFDVSVVLKDGASNLLSSDSELDLYTPGPGVTPSVALVGPSGGNDSVATPLHIYGSNFTGATSVSFGGVSLSSSHFTVSSNGDEIAVDAPAATGATTCAVSGETYDGNICQVQVQVTTSTGTSAEASILPQYSGSTSVSSPTAGTEWAPAASEFDYLPEPHISSISFRNGGTTASEEGGTVITVHGTGFGILGLLWENVGPYADESSYQYAQTSVTPTAITMTLPAITETTADVNEAVTIQTLGSTNNYGAGVAASAPSNAVDVTYAPPPAPVKAPVVTSVSTANGHSDGPTTGGEKVTIKGSGFNAATLVEFKDAYSSFDVSNATYYDFDVVSNKEITLTTVGANAGIDQVLVCSSKCSTNDVLYTYYPPGDPTISSVSPRSGASGTTVTITGRNLGFTTAVYFGTVKAKVFANGAALTDAGSFVQVVAKAPAGVKVGTKVNVRVETVESVTTKKYPKSPVNKSATFTYKK